MKLINEAEYKDWKAKNDDPYGAATFEFAEKWADLMEQEIESGSNLSDVADGCSQEANKGIGVTGFMYSCAVSILSQCWKHGEELRRWHNLDVQIGDEGERANEDGSVLNTALLGFGVQE